MNPWRDDTLTSTEHDAARFEAAHTPSRRDEAEAAGYDPADDTIGRTDRPCPPALAAAYIEAVRIREAAMVADAAWKRGRG